MTDAQRQDPGSNPQDLKTKELKPDPCTLHSSLQGPSIEESAIGTQSPAWMGCSARDYPKDVCFTILCVTATQMGIIQVCQNKGLSTAS